MLGVNHPDNLLQQLTASQLRGWMAYAAIEPFGEYRNELRHGQQMQLLHTAHFQPKEVRTVGDFMNFIEKPPEKPLTPEEIEQHLAGIFGA